MKSTLFLWWNIYGMCDKSHDHILDPLTRVESELGECGRLWNMQTGTCIGEKVEGSLIVYVAASSLNADDFRWRWWMHFVCKAVFWFRNGASHCTRQQLILWGRTEVGRHQSQMSLVCSLKVTFSTRHQSSRQRYTKLQSASLGIDMNSLNLQWKVCNHFVTFCNIWNCNILYMNFKEEEEACSASSCCTSLRRP